MGFNFGFKGLIHWQTVTDLLQMDGNVTESPVKKAQYYFLYCLVLKQFDYVYVCMLLKTGCLIHINAHNANTFHNFWTISNFFLKSIDSFLGSYFLRDANFARSSLAVMFRFRLLFRLLWSTASLLLSLLGGLTVVSTGGIPWKSKRKMTNTKPFKWSFLVGLHDMVKDCSDIFKKHTVFVFRISGCETGVLNLLKPNDIYICRTAALTSRCYILNIYSTNIHTEYFKQAA